MTGQLFLGNIQQNHSLYFSDILYIQAAHHVHSLAMQKRRWGTATMYGEIALVGFRKYYGEKACLVAALLVR